jgi:hypothetical protein
VIAAAILDTGKLHNQKELCFSTRPCGFGIRRALLRASLTEDAMSSLLPARKWEQYLHEVCLHWGLGQPSQPPQDLEQVVSLISTALGLPPQCARKELLALMEKFEERLARAA